MKDFLLDAIHKRVRYARWFLNLQKLFLHTPRENFMRDCMEYVKSSRIDGDYLEFGVYRGRTFVAAYHFAQDCRLDAMRFYGFDSFAGLPPIKGPDEAGEFTEGQYSMPLDAFRRLITRRGVSLDRVELIEGWYETTLVPARSESLPLRKAAFVFVDCDLYESTVHVLDFITGYVQNGTVLAFDDWNCFGADPERGERRAFAEWMQANPSLTASEFRRFGWHGNSFILRVAADPGP